MDEALARLLWDVREPHFGPGAEVGPYIIRQFVGFDDVYVSECYLAQRECSTRVVDLTLTYTGLSLGSSADERVRGFARARRAVLHPNVVQVHAAGALRIPRSVWVAQGRCGLARLGDWLVKGGSMPVPRAVAHITAVARATDVLEQHGLAPRCISPDDIFIGPDGATKLEDFKAACFGAGYLTEAWLARPRYHAPETRSQDPDGSKAVVFGLGAILYELVTGSPLFPNYQVYGHFYDGRRALDLAAAGSLSVLLGRMLAVDPRARPSVQELPRLLEGALLRQCGVVAGMHANSDIAASRLTARCADAPRGEGREQRPRYATSNRPQTQRHSHRALITLPERPAFANHRT